MPKFLASTIVVFSMITSVVVPLFFYSYVYLCIFKDYEFIWWALLLLPFWILVCSIANPYGPQKNTDRMLIYTGLSWVWTASIPASIYFLVTSIFMDGSWYEFLYAFLVGQFIGLVAKNFMREAIN